MELHNKLFQLSLDQNGQAHPAVRKNLEYYLLAAVLIEMFESKIIDISELRIEVKGAEANNKIFSHILDEIKKQPNERISYYIKKIVMGDVDIGGFMEILVSDLEEKGELEIKKSSFLGIFKKIKYKFKGKEGINKVKNKLVNLITDPAEPEKEVILLALVLNQLNIWDTLFNIEDAQKLNNLVNFSREDLKKHMTIIQEAYVAEALY